jgi:hypothetical protein
MTDMEKDNEIPFPKLDRTELSTAPLFDQSDWVAYWHSRTPEERLQYMELLRRTNYGDKATGRLQRVLEIVKGPSH